MNRILVTKGHGEFYEDTYHLPPITDDEICVRSIMTGVCRSDIDMMNGKFGPLPLNMQGHEGIGQVVKVGKNINDVTIDDYVATRGEPAYADFYNVRSEEYVVIPEAHPKYIIEPVACGINLIQQPIEELKKRSGPKNKLLILGSGFLAWVAYHAIKFNQLEFDITVVGNSNKDLWKEKLSQTYEGKFDVVIDLSSKDDLFIRDILQNEALIIFGVEKQITTSFSNLLWKACTIVFPSPRTKRFYSCMQLAVNLIKNGNLNVDKFWSKGYNRNTDWKQAFSDGNNRIENYSRGYIKWD